MQIHRVKSGNMRRYIWHISATHWHIVYCIMATVRSRQQWCNQVTAAEFLLVYAKRNTRGSIAVVETAVSVYITVSLLKAGGAWLWTDDKVQVCGCRWAWAVWGITNTGGEDKRPQIGALSSSLMWESQVLYAPLPQEQGEWGWPPLLLTPSGVWLLPPSLLLIQMGHA